MVDNSKSSDDHQKKSIIRTGRRGGKTVDAATIAARESLEGRIIIIDEAQTNPGLALGEFKEIKGGDLND